MKYSEKSLQKIIKDSIFEICQKEVEDYDENLLSMTYGIPAVEFLYIFALIEQKTKANVASVLEENSYKVFTINNLARKIFDKYSINEAMQKDLRKEELV